MKKLIIVFVLFFQMNLYADEDIEKTLKDVAQYYSNEDCASFADCFVGSLKNQKRRQAAIFFASNNNLSLEVPEFHVIKEEDDTAEIAVHYILNQVNFSSLMVLQKENNSWKIKKETNIVNLDNLRHQEQSRVQISAVNNQPVIELNMFDEQSLPGCSSGRCGL